MQDLCGYVYIPKEIERIMGMQPNPVMYCSALGIQDSGKGKDVFLFEIERAVAGKVRPPHNQTIGDCVSHGNTGAYEDLEFVQIAKDGTLEFHWIATEVLYGLCRHQIGKDQCGGQDGAVVGWGVEAARKYGLIARGVYGSYDLSEYSGQTAKKFGAPGAGPPPALITESGKHLVKEASAIEGPDYYSQAIDVLANAGLIITGSNQLYGSARDANGFCRPQGQGGHCTYYRGFSDNSKRPGIIYQQSWGNDVPTGGETKITLPHGREVILPAGAFLIDADNFNKMHRNGGEVWAVTSEEGFQKPDIDVDFAFYN